MPDECAYRSTHPDVLAAWEKRCTDSVAWNEAVFAWCDELGIPRRIMLAGDQLTGFPDPGTAAIPDGWRITERRGAQVMVPDQRTKVGKAAAKRLRDFPRHPVASDLPGMPDEVWVPAGRFDGACAIHRAQGVTLHDGALWVRWQLRPEVVEAPRGGLPNTMPDFRRQVFDGALWERVKLSEYHAAVEEAAEAAKATAVG